MADAPWLRLDITELQADWLEDLDPLCALAWVQLMAYLKASAPSQKRPGRAPSISARTASRLWRVPVELVEAMLEAAQRCGRLVCDDEYWQATDTTPYVSQRAAEYREKPAPAQPGPTEEPEQDFSAKREKRRKTRKMAQNDAKPETLSRDRTGQDSNTEANASDGQPSKAPPGGEAPEGGSRPSLAVVQVSPPEAEAEPAMTPYARAERVLSAIACHLGWQPPEPPDVRREIAAKRANLLGVLAWLEGPKPPSVDAVARLLGGWKEPGPSPWASLANQAEQTAAAMWLRAWLAWRTEGAPTWSYIHSQRQALLTAPKASLAKPEPGQVLSVQDRADHLLQQMRGGGS